MATKPPLLPIALRLQTLKANAKELHEEIARLEKELADPTLSFEVTFLVKSKPSGWDEGHLDADEMRRQFERNIPAMAEALYLNDSGDSIEVTNCVQVG